MQLSRYSQVSAGAEEITRIVVLLRDRLHFKYLSGSFTVAGCENRGVNPLELAIPKELVDCQSGAAANSHRRAKIGSSPSKMLNPSEEFLQPLSLQR